MRAAIYRDFGGPIAIETVPDPTISADGALVALGAAGVCRSDLWGWQGSDPEIDLPHVGGHEFAGVIVAVGDLVSRFAIGDRVTAPFCCGCGICSICQSGNSQVCSAPFQPGFTGWGSFAEYVAIPNADFNLVELPKDLEVADAAILGCRFITAYRAIVERARIQPGRWLSVHGCGGLGLSAAMIASAMGTRVVAVDIDELALDRARNVGATATINAHDVDDVASVIREITSGGAHYSIDAFGSDAAVGDALRGLRKMGRHIQAGLSHRSDANVPMSVVIANELELLGTHGMAGHRYAEVFDALSRYGLDLSLLVDRTISLAEVPTALAAMRDNQPLGVAVVTEF